MTSPPTIIYDDREKTPWVITGFTAQRKRMPFGDYTIKGMENVLRIERKHGWSELVSNLATTRKRSNLYRNIRALARLKLNGGIAAVFVEDNPVTLPLATKHATSPYVTYLTIIRFCTECQINYGVPVIPIGTGTMKEAYIHDFFHSILTAHKKGRAWYKRKEFI